MKNRYGLEIRAATSADGEGLSDLIRATGRHLSPRDAAERLEAMKNLPGAALIAAEQGAPIGLVALHWYQTLGSHLPTAQITTLLVASAERRRGIGRLLVKAAAQAARMGGCGGLQLMVSPEQLGLLEFCLSSGFTEDGRCLVRPLRKNGSSG